MSLNIPNTFFKPYNFLAIDPGSNFLGLAVYTIDPSYNSILNIKTFSIIVEYVPAPFYVNSDLYSGRTEKLLKINEEIRRFLIYYNIKLVVCEAPFYNRLRPTAYGPLVEVMATIQKTVLEYNNEVPFLTVEPSVIKKAVGAGHISGKDEVKKAIGANPEITSKLEINLNLIDEHAVDAIAIGYTFLKWNSKKG